MPSEQKSDYQAKLRERAEQVYHEVSDAGIGESRKSSEIIYEALRAVALESWKNGLEAGRRKSQPKAQGSHKAA